MGNSFDIRRRRRPRPAPSQPTKKAKRSFGMFLFLVIVAGLILAANGKFAAQAPTAITSTAGLVSTPPTTATPTTTIMSSATPSPTPTTETPTLTPTPTPTIDKTAITMSILNGSGTAGEANTLRAQLVSDGFTIRRIAVASAKRTTTMVYYQAGHKTDAEFVGGFIPNHVLEFEENSGEASPDTLLIIIGTQ